MKSVKGRPRHFQTCWSNKDVDVAVCRTRKLFRIWKQSWNDEDRKKTHEVVENVDLCQDGCELFRIPKQRTGENRDVVGVSCLKDESGAVRVWLIKRKSGRSLWIS